MANLLTPEILIVTICTTRFNIQQFCVLPTQCIYVFCVDLRTNSDLTLYSPVVTICTTRFNIQQFCVLPTHCIYVFCVDLRTNSHHFPIQH